MRIIDLTQQATRALELEHGPIHAEIRGDGEALWFIEVAARSIGGYCSKVLRFEGGLTLEDIIIRHALAPDDPLPDLEPGAAGVLMMQARQSGRFVEIHGLDAVSELPEIDEVVISVHAGQKLTPLPDGFLYLGFVFARAATAEAAEQSLRKADELLGIVVE